MSLSVLAPSFNCAAKFLCFPAQSVARIFLLHFLGKRSRSLFLWKPVHPCANPRQRGPKGQEAGIALSNRRTSLWYSSESAEGRREPNLPKNCLGSARSVSQLTGSTRKSSRSDSGESFRPSRVSALRVGTYPIGVSSASPRPSTRSRIHFSTRTFSPKPGHRYLPSAPLRNQFT